MNPKTTTKDKILQKAIALFNRFGIVSVRLQFIADEAEISIGNLAYHFKNKDAIFEAIYNDIELLQKELLNELKIVPLFENIDYHIVKTFELQQNYSFFYSDTFEILRAYPIVKKKYRQYTEWFIQQLVLMFRFNVSRGVFRGEVLAEDQIQIAAQKYWTSLELWLYQNRLRGDENINLEAFRTFVWNEIIPYFNEIGFVEYKQLLMDNNFNQDL